MALVKIAFYSHCTQGPTPLSGGWGARLLCNTSGHGGHCGHGGRGGHGGHGGQVGMVNMVNMVDMVGMVNIVGKVNMVDMETNFPQTSQMPLIL